MFHKILRIIFFAVLILFFFEYFLYPVEIDDVWWHLGTGKWIFQNLAVPQQDIFPFAGEPEPWVFTQWLGSSFLYLVFQAGGLTGLRIFRAVSFVLMLMIFFFYAYKKVPLTRLVLLVFLLAASLVPRCLLRPLIFNFFFIQIFLINLFAYERNSRWRNLLYLPIGGIVWVNLHLGSLAYGAALMGIFLVSSGIQWGMARHARDTEKEIVLAKKTQGLLAALLIYLMVFLVNPYGLKGAWYPFKVFLEPGFINFYFYNHFISEMQSPVKFLLEPLGVPFLLLFLWGAYALVTTRKARTTLALLFSGALFFFFQGMRGCAFFAIVSVYIIAQSAADQLPENGARVSASGKRLYSFFYAAVILLLGFHLIQGFFEKVSYGRQTVPAMSLDYPVQNPFSCIRYLKENGIKGRVFNDDSFGGYIIWTSYPELKPFVDGRQLSQKSFLRYIEILLSPEDHWPAAEKEFRFDIILLDPSKVISQKLIHYLKADPGWECVREEDACRLYIKR
ncbi:MAG: hypothetical protein WC552_06675 [Candidatus Omnitrophota bacterium]